MEAGKVAVMSRTEWSREGVAFGFPVLLLGACRPVGAAVGL